MTALRELTAADIAALAGILAKLRPHGARQWEPPGIRAALGKAAHLNAADVLMAAIRLSQDRTAHTPGQIAIPSSECWREKPAAPTPTKPTVCRIHGTQHHGPCPSCRADELAHDPHPKPPGQRRPPDQITAVITELRDIAAHTSQENR